MEQRMTRALKIVRAMDSALNAFELVQGDIRTLDEYYGSDEWKADLAADEAGLLPPTLKRGVLSEDGIWNLLEDNKDLLRRITNRSSDL
ncbi:MAG: DUF4298 domain-containing protein [Bacteroidaceae bacterium]|nr:DUF4298 domain-containing protein [Bacteroidaceae bacterium]